VGDQDEFLLLKVITYEFPRTYLGMVRIEKKFSKLLG